MIRNLVDYKEIYKNNEIIIKDVDGYTCTECDNEFISDESKNYIEQQLKSERLKVMSEKDIVHITVNSLKRVRINKYLSQKELGNALGVSEQRYGAIERNTNTPIITMGLILAKFLGVELQDLYQLVDVPRELYEKLLNAKIEELPDGGYEFIQIKEVAETRAQVKKLQADLEEYNNRKRKLRFLPSDEIQKKETKALKKDLDKKINEIKKLKNGSRGLETHLKKLENKHSIILKQESVLDIEDWEKVQIKFEDELK